MANPTKKSQKRPDNGINTPAEVNMVAWVESSTMLNVPTPGVRYTATMATSMKALPKIVNIRNFMAEYSFRPLPHTEMSMNMGTSSNSQNRKKSSRSMEVNTPITAVWSTSSQMKYSLTRRPMCQDASTAHMPSSPVNATRGALRPSTVSRKSAFSPTPGIQGILSTNWNRAAPSPRSKKPNTKRDRTRSARKISTAKFRMLRSPLTTNSNSTAPTAGRNTVAVNSPL